MGPCYSTPCKTTVWITQSILLMENVSLLWDTQNFKVFCHLPYCKPMSGEAQSPAGRLSVPRAGSCSQSGYLMTLGAKYDAE